MKKTIVGILMLFFLSLVGCNSLDVGALDVDASVPVGYQLVSTDKQIVMGLNVSVIKHKQTGCYYTITKAVDSGGITQMYVERAGVSVPYCDK